MIKKKHPKRRARTPQDQHGLRVAARCSQSEEVMREIETLEALQKMLNGSREHLRALRRLSRDRKLAEIETTSDGPNNIAHCTVKADVGVSPSLKARRSLVSKSHLHKERGVVVAQLPAWEVKVPKALISKADLERIALQEIRNFPGSEHVRSVEVESHGNAPRGIDWRLYVIANDEGDLDRIQYAVKVTTDRLKRRYDLRSS